MKIAFLSGSFDPPHIGHLILPCIAIEKFDIDLFLYIPSKIAVNKDHHFAEASDRYNMLQLMISDNPGLMIDNFEISQDSKIYTFETINYLKRKYSTNSTNLMLCIGSDWIDSLDKWQNFDFIKDNVSFIIFLRPPYIDGIDKKLENLGIDQDNYHILDNLIDINSSNIRTLIKEGKPFSHFLSKPVYDYIMKNSLYLV